jgi:hypothetical protein
MHRSYYEGTKEVTIPHGPPQSTCQRIEDLKMSGTTICATPKIKAMEINFPKMEVNPPERQ